MAGKRRTFRSKAQPRGEANCHPVATPVIASERARIMALLRRQGLSARAQLSPASSGRCRIGELFDPALGRSRRAPLLEALPAEDRPALGWLKGNSGFLAATRTIRPGLYFGVITCGGCR